MFYMRFLVTPSTYESAAVTPDKQASERVSNGGRWLEVVRSLLVVSLRVVGFVWGVVITVQEGLLGCHAKNTDAGTSGDGWSKVSVYFANGTCVVGGVAPIHVACRCPDTGFFWARRVKLDRADILRRYCVYLFIYLFINYLSFVCLTPNDYVLMNYEMEELCCSQRYWLNLRHHSCNRLEGLRKTIKNLDHNSLYPNRFSNFDSFQWMHIVL